MKKVKLFAKAAFLNGEGKILILTRSKTHPVLPGELDLPGGGIDEGENIDDGFLREIKEETGLNLSIDEVSLVYAETVYYEATTSILFLYTSKLDSNTSIKLSYEHSEMAWLSLNELKEKTLHPIWKKAIIFASDHNLLPR